MSFTSSRLRTFGWAGLVIMLGVWLLAPDPSHLLNHFPHHDEALAILLGRAVLAGQSCDGACAQHTGSVLIHPVAAAFGDRWDGLYGARLISVGFGLAALAAVIMTGRLLIGPMGGWLAGALLLTQGPFLYVSRMALYDVVAAAWLAVAMMALVAAEQHRGRWSAGIWLVAAAVSLVGASMAKYVTVWAVPVAFVIVLWRFRLVQALTWFVAPVVLLGGWYVWSVMPWLPDVMGQARGVTGRGQTGFSVPDIIGMLFHWFCWPAVFAAVGVALASTPLPGRPQEPAASGRIKSPPRGVWWVLILAALQIPLIHLGTGAVQGLNKNVVQSLVLLAPVAAYGLLRVTQPFHLPRAVNAQWVVIVALVGALAWGGWRERQWLEHQYPDLTPVGEDLRQAVTPTTVIMTDTDALWRYLMADRLRPDQVVLTYWVDVDGTGGETGAQRFVEAGRANFVLLDGYYGQPDQHERLKEAMGDRYRLRRQWPMRLSWGERTVELYERKGVTE
ncbi:MAG: phospholipid carrier-dependent glycosyltransferase [Nitrospirae bacterium]|nr:phospholipid carrier-dependent glycosyltransferase [Nitrospirota bacterium]